MNLTLSATEMQFVSRILTAFQANFTQNGNNLTLEENEDWNSTFLSYLPNIIQSLKENDQNRNPRRSFQHIVSAEEFVLLVKLHKEQSLALALGENIAEEYQRLVEDTAYIADHQLELFVKILLSLEIETDYLKRRDDLRYGDIIRHNFFNYRNNGVFLYNGDIAVHLSTQNDSNGSIPRTFPAVSEFPIMYFSDAIQLNKHVWIPRGLNCAQIITDYNPEKNDFDGAMEMLEALSDLREEIDDYNQDSDSLKSCVLVIRSSHCDTDPMEKVEHNYIVFLYEEESEINIDKLFMNGVYADYYSENVAVVNNVYF